MFEIPQDTMTPMERNIAYAKGERVDRIPVGVSFGETAANYFDISIKDMYFDSNLIANLEKLKIEKLGVEGASVLLMNVGIGHALGSKIAFYDDRVSSIVDPVLIDYNMLDDLILVDPEKDGTLPYLLEALDILNHDLTEEPVKLTIAGPITQAHGIRGESQLLKDTLKQPDNLRKLLDYTIANLLTFVSKANQVVPNLATSINDPLASPNIISPHSFEKIIYPALDKLVNGIIEITGRPPGLHICGRTKPVWKHLKMLNIASFSVDNIEDMYEVKEYFGDKMMIVGNVPPVTVISNGGKKDIFKSVKDCLTKASDSPNGYTLAAGCAIPPTAPLENIKAFKDAARYYSQGIRKGELIKIVT